MSEESHRLPQNLKAHWVWAISLGSAIGWGAFILPSDWIGKAGPLGALLGLSIGGLLMIIVGVSYGFLARVFPVSGGAFSYTLIALGRRHAFVCAWFMTLGYVSIVALNATALGVLARHIAPGIAEFGYLYSVAGWDVHLGEVAIATVGLLFFAFLNVRGGGNSARLQFYMCVLMIASMLIVFFGVLLSDQGQISNMQPLFVEDKAPIAGVLAIVAIAPWAYIGFDSIPQTAEEFSFSPAKAFRLIWLSLLVATGLYLLMIMTTAVGAPWQERLAGNPVWLTADIVRETMGTPGVALLCIAAFMGIATGLNGFYMASSRVLLAMSRAGMVPEAFGRIHPKYKTPSVGVVFTCAVSFIAPWFGRTALNWIVDMASIGFTFAFAYTCLTAYLFSRWSNQSEIVPGAASTTQKLLAGFGVLISVAFMLVLLFPGSPGQLSTPSFIAMAVWTVIGLVFYFTSAKRSASLSDSELDVAVLGSVRPEWARTSF
ncbi:MAG: APC family permease [Ancrocorticia sp.]